MLLNKIILTIKEAKKIAILPHINMDGDALGSCLAMTLALKKLGKDVVVLFEEDIPHTYNFLPGKQLGKVYDDSLKGREKYDVVISIDSSDIERLGKRVEVFKSSPITINIDHHGTNTEFAFYNHVEAGAAAAGEIIYRVIKMMGVDMDIDIATCLYVAIVTDTGSFKYSNTKAISHIIVAELIDTGVDVADLSVRIFDNMKLEKLRLMGKAVENIEFFENGKIGLIFLDSQLLNLVGATDEDCDGIVSMLRNIEGVEVAVLARQKKDGLIKVSLRSKLYADVASVAGLFKGGGHTRAAGFSFQGNFGDIKEALLKDIREIL